MVPTEFANSLAPGVIVELRWTNCNRYFKANATIVAVNGKTLRAKLNHHIPGTGSRNSYDKGDIIKVARPYERGYTQNNGAWPLAKTDAELIADAELFASAVRKLNQKIGEAIERGRAEREQLEANSTSEALQAAQEPIRIT